MTIFKRTPDILSSEITPERDYLGRREFVRNAGLLAVSAIATPRLLDLGRLRAGTSRARQADEPNSYDEITSYNNYYEFGTDKEDPKANSGDFHPLPWSVRVEGLCKKKGNYAFEDLIKPHKIEDRVYRLRCVEAWSMVIPWQGIPLAAMIQRFEPLPSAK